MRNKIALALVSGLFVFGSRPVQAFDLTLTWAASAHQNTFAYRLYQRTRTAAHFVPKTAVHTTQITLIGLGEGKVYYFKVGAWIRSGGAIEYTDEIAYYARPSRAPRGQETRLVTLAAEPGAHYLVESSNDQQNWQAVADVAASSSILQYTVSPAGSARFLRIRRQRRPSTSAFVESLR
jgi:hypothetical protein